jgi:hypothetical protein
MTRVTTRFTHADANRAYDEWGCNCGPGALAAVLDITLDQARPLIPGFDAKRYTSPSMMNAALRAFGRSWRKIGAQWPEYGLARIQWEGPWTEPGVPMVARYRHTHWVGAQRGRADIGIFDINCMNNGTGWVSLSDWAGYVAPWLSALTKHATGKWHLTHAIEVNEP